MGFDFTQNAAKQEIVKQCLTPEADWNPVAHRLIGNNLWTIIERGRGERFICLFRLEHEKGFGWGYKAMDESTGPFQYNCPVQFLDVVAVPDSPYVAEWRKKVREHAKGLPSNDHLRSTDGVEGTL